MLFILALLILLISLTVALKYGKGDYVYHGSRIKIDELIPHASNAIHGESAVFFGVGGTDYNFSFGSVNGVSYSTEQYRGAFKKMHRDVYIHYLDAGKFQADPRMQSVLLRSGKSMHGRN